MRAAPSTPPSWRRVCGCNQRSPHGWATAHRPNKEPGRLLWVRGVLLPATPLCQKGFVAPSLSVSPCEVSACRFERDKFCRAQGVGAPIGLPSLLIRMLHHHGLLRAPFQADSAIVKMEANDGDTTWEFLAPRALLLAVAIGYGTNFPVGRYLNEALPAAAATSSRFALATLVLSPYIPRLRPSLIAPCLLSGVLDAIGYCSQSVSLISTPAAKVSFLGALTVVWIPFLSVALDGRKLGIRQWVASLVCLGGVGFLELGGSPDALLSPSGVGVTSGDIFATVQAIAFGSSIYLIERIMSGETQATDDSDAAAAVEQTLAVTAINIAVVAAFAAIWALLDGCGFGPFAASPTAGWLLDESTRSSCALPGALLSPSTSFALLWTGLVTTAAVRIGETTGLSRVAASDASVIVATEPLWASLFGILLLGEGLQMNELVGGALVVAAPLISVSEPSSSSSG